MKTLILSSLGCENYLREVSEYFGTLEIKIETENELKCGMQLLLFGVKQEKSAKRT